MALLSLEDKLRASIDLVHAKKAAELLEYGRAAALLISKVAKPDTGEVVLGCNFPVEVVRAFARLVGSETSSHHSADRSTEWVKANVNGVTITISGGVQ